MKQHLVLQLRTPLMTSNSAQRQALTLTYPDKTSNQLTDNSRLI